MHCQLSLWKCDPLSFKLFFEFNSKKVWFWESSDEPECHVSCNAHQGFNSLVPLINAGPRTIYDLLRHARVLEYHGKGTYQCVTACHGVELNLCHGEGSQHLTRKHDTQQTETPFIPKPLYSGFRDEKTDVDSA